MGQSGGGKKSHHLPWFAHFRSPVPRMLAHAHKLALSDFWCWCVVLTLLYTIAVVDEQLVGHCYLII